MSDLQCAATVLLVDEAQLTVGGLSTAQSLIDGGDRRVLMVYGSTEPDALQRAKALAQKLGAPWRELPGVQALEEGESDLQAVDRYRRALEEVADVHRGETVVVVSHERVMRLVLPRLASARVAAERGSPGVSELLIDSDGWALRG